MKELTILYRVQDKEGGGPYTGSYMPIPMENGAHPAPIEDGLDWLKLSERFAFATPIALLRWFGSEIILRNLETYGYEVAMIAVPVESVRYGRRQATYEADAVVRVETHSFDKLIEFVVE